MSNKHHGDEKATQIFEEDGQQLINFHGKFYYPLETKNKEGQYVELDEEHVPTNAKPLDLSITKNVASMFISIALLLIVFISIARAYKKREGKAPKGLQSLLEPIIIFVR